MSKVAEYLREHIVGEVSTNTSARRFYSTDGSVFSVMPQIVIYPRSTDDIRKVARFSWQLAEKGKVVPITARGAGTDQGGAALGEGIVLVFPVHMNKLLELDTKKNFARMQPGINYRNFQDTIKTHNRFLPPYPSSVDISTIGGAVANNAAGSRTVKYGCTRDYVNGLRVVLANGELIETRRLSKRELNHKKGLATFEGEIYRQIDGLITDNWDLIHSAHKDVSKNSAGYDLMDVKRSDGSFDLTPLFVGSQGTLGIITEIELAITTNNMNRSLMVAGFTSIDQADSVVQDILKLKPATVEMVDYHLLEFINKHYPNQLKGLLEPPFPKILLLIEFDDFGKSIQAKKIKKLSKILRNVTNDFQVSTDYDEREELWKIRHSAAAVIAHTEGTKKSLPIIEDGVVPQEKFQEYVHGIYELFKKYNLDVAVWGHAGNANLHMQPILDLAEVGDRQKVFKIMDEYYQMVIQLGGSTAGEHSDGRLRAPYLPGLYGEEIYKIFEATKKVFDPWGTLNPGVKLGVTREDQKRMLRNEYNMDKLGIYTTRM
ncbi:FAD-binding protein [Candidatus Nomurabacteria bacterium]|nr:FAD-binding protein [Candidatus Saccharibacteria bacterium]MCB9821919.1 FAD-binding protein [Candidatus Nomurabacteria bacterium]